MASAPVPCPHCGYEIATFAELLEALEGGARCLLCGGALEPGGLEAALDAWSDEELLAAGEEKAEIEEEIAGEEELFEGTPDFGDEGEDEEDPLL